MVISIIKKFLNKLRFISVFIIKEMAKHKTKYNKIFNPMTNRFVSINGQTGKHIIQKYLSILRKKHGGSGSRSVQQAENYMCDDLGDTEEERVKNLITDYEYRLIQVHQQARVSKGYFKFAFEYLRHKWGKNAWHWAIQIKKIGDDSNNYCSVGLKKTADGKATEMTTPDVYDSFKCWREGKNMGCEIKEGTEFQKLNEYQAKILNLVLRQKKTEVKDSKGNTSHHKKTYSLPYVFSYLAHTSVGSKDYFNCNKFANHFKDDAENLYQGMILSNLDISAAISAVIQQKKEKEKKAGKKAVVKTPSDDNDDDEFIDDSDSESYDHTGRGRRTGR